MPMTTPGKFDSNGAWDGFRGEIWQEEINVRDFIQKNYTPYDGDEAFLTDPTDRTQKLWNHVQKLQKEEREKALSVSREYLALPDGPGRFAQDSSCPALLRIPLCLIWLRVQDYHLL